VRPKAEIIDDHDGGRAPASDAAEAQAPGRSQAHLERGRAAIAPRNKRSKGARSAASRQGVARGRGTSRGCFAHVAIHSFSENNRLHIRFPGEAVKRGIKKHPAGGIPGRVPATLRGQVPYTLSNVPGFYFSQGPGKKTHPEPDCRLTQAACMRALTARGERRRTRMDPSTKTAAARGLVRLTF